jgi:hypothetical protein
MESKAHKANNNKRGGLPNYFKKVGLLLILITIIFAVIYQFILFKKSSVLSKHIFLDTLIIGLFLFSFANEKLEDERIMLIRLKAIAQAFVFALTITIISPVFFAVFGNELRDLSSIEVILNMLTMYNISFYIQKRADK